MKRQLRSGLLVFLFLAIQTVTLPQARATSDRTVARQLEALFADPAFEKAFWGVKVTDLESGHVIFEQNAHKRFVPASNMKLVTALAALNRLGGDLHLVTEIRTDGQVREGRLEGDLIVVGSGDPTLGARLSHAPVGTRTEEAFADWIEQLRDLGIETIEGNLVGDESLFDPTPLGAGWAWDDIPYGYSAEVGPIQYQENRFLLQVSPGRIEEEPGLLQIQPQFSWITVENDTRTVPARDESRLQVKRLGTNHFRLTGEVSLREKDPIRISLAVENAGLHFLRAFEEQLEEAGIEVQGSLLVRSPDDSATRPETAEILIRHESPPLRVILAELLKVSQNLYAESLVRLMDPSDTGKRAEEGLEEVELFLTRIGIPSDSYFLADGSGLSRYNLLTADSLVRLLDYAYRSPFGDQFREMLPEAGVDGTIRSRMRGTRAEGQVWAKTGSLAHVRALSGYVESVSGRMVAFSFLANHFTQSRRTAEYLQDMATRILVGYTGPPEEEFIPGD